jgi:hypothetical protein
MNDFTKDELNTMADGIVFIMDKCKTSDATRQHLQEIDQKLCSMINNYCEQDCRHEPDGYYYHPNGEPVLCYSLPIHSQQKCIKCGEFYR